jgi:predicted RNase H-like HicB family nuclease
MSRASTSEARMLQCGTVEVPAMTNLETQSLFAISRTNNDHYLITSPLIPELVTEGDDERDSIEHLEDALGLLIDVMDETKNTEKFDLSYADVSINNAQNAKSLVDISYTNDNSILLSSALIPILLTEGRGVKDALTHLKDALGLILEINPSQNLLKNLKRI